MSAPRVSVILPTHNREALLRRSLASVLGQTFADLEIIVIDNACTDGSTAYLKTITDPRLRVIRFDELRGASAARNAASALAQAPLLAFQDDDDVWLPHKLKAQVAALEQAGPDTGLCLAGYIRQFPGHVQAVYARRYFYAMDFDSGVVLGDFSALTTPAWLVRKALVERAGGFDEQLSARNDWELALRLRELCAFTYVDEPLWIQDQTRETAMRRNEARYVQALKRIAIKHEERWRGRPDARASHAALIGRYEATVGNLAEARQWLAASLRDRPLQPRIALMLALTWLGPGLVARARQLRQKIRAF